MTISIFRFHAGPGGGRFDALPPTSILWIYGIPPDVLLYEIKPQKTERSLEMKLDSTPARFMAEAIGTEIEIISNEFQERPGPEGQAYSYQKIVFQMKDEEPDLFAFSILFTLSLMSFTYAAPRGYSEKLFIPDEEWNLDYFIQGLRYENKNLHFSADYVSGRMMKTDIDFESGGRVTIKTRNRGRGAERWLTHLQGKPHIHAVGNNS
jgi:hypothetical protein